MDYKTLLKESYNIALNSPDPSTQNGAILVNPDTGLSFSSGCNEFPPGVLYNDERWQRPLKYKVIERAERRVVYNAARDGFKTQGSIMVCGWAACSDCSRAIICAGIKTLITHKQAHDRSPDFWKQEIDIAMQMFAEAGVQVIFYDGLVDGPELLHSGEKWKP